MYNIECGFMITSATCLLQSWGEQALLTLQAELEKSGELVYQCHQMQYSKQSVTWNKSNRCEQEVHGGLSTLKCFLDGQFTTIFLKCTPVLSEYHTLSALVEGSLHLIVVLTSNDTRYLGNPTGATLTC